MAWRQRSFSKTTQPKECECSCPEAAHWSKDGHCVVKACGCLAFRPKKSGNKYNAAKTEIKGQKFDSKFEGKVGTDLKYRAMAGEKFTIRRQVDFPMIVNGRKITTYRADFVLEHEDGTTEIVEAKGLSTHEFRIKWKLLEALYPEIKLTMEMCVNGWGRRR